MRKTTILLLCVLLLTLSCNRQADLNNHNQHIFNGEYFGDYLNRLAFPIGGIGAGMICMEGNGSSSHVSVRHTPDIFNTPFMFASISVKGIENGAKILEGPVQDWKIFGSPKTGNGSAPFGVPRFETASFKARFPFGETILKDDDMPLQAKITGWSPFIPTDADNSSLPVGGLEYAFENTSSETLDAMFSFNSENFMRIEIPSEWGGNYVGKDSIMELKNGFILEQSCLPEKPHYKGEFAIYTDEPNAVIDYCWFRGRWFDSRTMLWKNITNLAPASNPVTKGAKGASIYVPFTLKPRQTKTIRVYMAWHVPHSDQKRGISPEDDKLVKTVNNKVCAPSSGCCPDNYSQVYYEPWYYSKFKDAKEVAGYWLKNYNDLRSKSGIFSETFYKSDLPDEVLEAVSANLTILKSPTVLRQKDGRLWAWEGCFDLGGCCHGSCTHVWNYAQAIPNLFPSLERTLRETEYNDNQNKEGHQNFRATLPIKINVHDFHAASDGQLGGVMKVYREWQISGDTEWMKKLWPEVKSSLDYCIEQWDPRHAGVLEEPHHNTYDIEFWGADGMCTSFYLGALSAAIEMGNYLNDDVSSYNELLDKGVKRMESELYNGEYFIQKVQWEGLDAPSPTELAKHSLVGAYSEEALKILEKEGPKYQYGNGCISDGVLGCWIAEMCGVPVPFDAEKIKSHLNSVYKYNLKKDLSDHVNPQRAGYAFGKEGGLLLCSWPKGNKPTFPFVYSDEVWTGIEYQVASHLMLMGETEKGLEIVREVRKRYDGRIRNPFNEYECGHWYARAMSSYGLIQGMTGIKYNAINQTMSMNLSLGNNFKCFFSCETGFGLTGLKDGKPFIDVKYGTVTVKDFIVDGKKIDEL